MSISAQTELQGLYKHINRILPKVIDFDYFHLNVDESSASIYKNNDFWSISKSKMFDEIYEKYQPKIVFDVGANCGFMTLLFSKKFQKSKIFSIEPNTNLVPIIEKNLKENDVINVIVINKIVGEKCINNVSFQVNNLLSVDSRVIGLTDNFQTLNLDQVSIDYLLKVNEISFQDSVFVKIDTQGFEKSVIYGAVNFLDNFSSYVIVMEFAPFWLEASGTNPVEFLSFLCDNYNVCEVPASHNFFSENLKTLQSKKLTKIDADSFVDYVRDSQRDGKGWVDVMIFKG